MKNPFKAGTPHPAEAEAETVPAAPAELPVKPQDVPATPAPADKKACFGPTGPAIPADPFGPTP